MILTIGRVRTFVAGGEGDGLNGVVDNRDRDVGSIGARGSDRQEGEQSEDTDHRLFSTEANGAADSSLLELESVYRRSFQVPSITVSPRPAAIVRH